MIIREAIQNDKEQWSSMRTQLWPDTPDNHQSEIKEYFSGTSIDIVQVYVIEDNTASLVGFLELNIRNFAEGSRSPRVPYIEGWYIDPQYRGRGYGHQLIDKAEQWALELGFIELASDTEIDNHTSIAMHKHMGFKETERVACFLKPLK